MVTTKAKSLPGKPEVDIVELIYDNKYAYFTETKVGKCKNGQTVAVEVLNGINEQGLPNYLGLLS
jgi:hypothetical protein